jgi:hypothetical protein
MVHMEVVLTHFLDAGEPYGDELHDYRYEGDTYTFFNDSERIQVRSYSDEPATAYFVSLTCALVLSASSQLGARIGRRRRVSVAA